LKFISISNLPQEYLLNKTQEKQEKL